MSDLAPFVTQSEKIKIIDVDICTLRHPRHMTDTPVTSIEQATSEELTEIITGLEQYRERLVNDTLSMAQKAKVMKTQAMASLEPQLAQIDAQLNVLRQRQAALTTEH